MLSTTASLFSLSVAFRLLVAGCTEELAVRGFRGGVFIGCKLTNMETKLRDLPAQLEIRLVLRRVSVYILIYIDVVALIG